MIAAYVRVSSPAQSHAMQRDAIERAAKARGESVDTWYSEKVSATTSRTKRPELEALRQASREGAHSTVYVYRIDRLTRTGIRDTLHVVEELRQHGTTVVSVSDGFDLTGPAAEIVLAVLAWAAKMEGEAINERTRAARTRFEAAGGRWGRPARMGLHELARATRYRKEGHTIRWIAAALKVPRATVSRTLRASSRKTPGKSVKKARSK